MAIPYFLLPQKSRRRSVRNGFSLIELLIVIAIILIILTVAVPKLTNIRRSGQEMAAIVALKTLHTAQTQYYSQYGTYATSLTQLGPPANGAASAAGAEIIDRDLAGGEKGGFKFTLQPTPTGYAVTAVPMQFGTSGTHTYFTDQSQSIHIHSGQEPASVTDPLAGETQQQQQQQK